MPLKGKAIMIVWHDIRQGSEPDYHLWHTREHMPERLAVRGFLRGRRGVDWNRDRHRYLTLYEGESIGTFGSPEYLRRLNNPTPWTLRTQPTFYNFIRCACVLAASIGRGVGGAMATIRVPFNGVDDAGFRALAQPLAEEIIELEGVSAVHLAVARPDVTGAKTRETELRGMTRDDIFDAVIMIDGIGRRELDRLDAKIMGRLRARGLSIDPAEAAIYDMAFCLDATD
ncbi:hypothetical protein MesoLjLc_55780 [Mesorhizobium sp. L-8-10]|uniref:hypothetical protein n=1 Tax=Mesorhizobium sp. L-8-10 TaxID=2744523 RepID=UPI0019255CA7|nr:hypothetical protein [Mesorhizobium sp. L-8-10]BCH33648.1 hypothetical protein MesoLjLc_55780 [Mesorhizobium sp. L-8-10]